MIDLSPASLLSLVLVASVSSLLQQSDQCNSYDLWRASFNLSCPKVPYWRAVGEAEGIIKETSFLFTRVITTASPSNYLRFPNSQARRMTRFLLKQLELLADYMANSRSYRRYYVNVLAAWTQDVNDRYHFLPIQHEGRAAVINAPGLRSSTLLKLALEVEFPWVWYASEDYIIVAVSSGCLTPIDLAVWLDSSGSVDYPDFVRSKQLVNSLLSRFDISHSGTQVSVGTFSSTITYTDFNSIDNLNEAIDEVNDLPYQRGYTYTDLALEAWYRYIFTQSGGVRPIDEGIARVGLFLTDGRASRSFDRHLAPLRDLSLTIYSIGVGDRISESQLQTIATSPAEQHTLVVDDFSSLSAFVDVLTASICGSPSYLGGNQEQSSEGQEGEVRYFRSQCSFLASRVNIQVETTLGDNELYASSTLQKPGLFSATNLVVRNTNTLQRFKRVSVDLNQGAENVYIGVRCTSRSQFVISFWEDYFNQDEMDIFIDGDAPENSLVTRIASAYIANYNDFIFSISNGNSEGIFAINSLGQLTTTKTLRIDHLRFSLTILIASKTITCRQSRIIIHVNIRHTRNRFNPSINNPISSLSVSERQQISEKIHDFDITDQDSGSNGVVTVRIISGDPDGIFDITNSGVLYLVKEVNASITDHFDLILEAKDNGSHPLVTRHRFVVMVLDINEPPFFINGCEQRFACSCTISEGIPANTIVCNDLVLGFDYDQNENKQIYYKIFLDPLPIDISSTGQLFTKELIDREKLLPYVDLEGKVMISNFPNFRESTVGSLRIVIEDVNDNSPKFLASYYLFRIPEDASIDTLVGQVKAIDPDSGKAGEVFYSIASQINVPFQINENGSLLVGDMLDKETVERYTFHVEATDNDTPYLSGTAFVTVIILDVNDNRPSFTQSIYFAYVEENIIGQPIQYNGSSLQADDMDGTPLSYSLVNQNTQPFKIDSSSGQIFPSVELDAEINLDYHLLVLVNDNGNPPQLASSRVIVKVKDVNDRPPMFLQSMFIFNVLEGSPIGTIVEQVQAFDDDVTSQSLTYSLQRQNRIPFSINTSTGEIAVTEVLDFDVATEYNLTVVAEDDGRPSPLRSFVVVTIKVVEIVPPSPSVNESLVELSIPEDVFVGFELVQIDGLSADIRFSIVSGNTKGHFALNESSGILTTATSLDFERIRQYTLTIKVFAAMHPELHSNVTVIVNVTDVNDNRPVLLGVPSTPLTLPENELPRKLFMVNVSDDDSRIWFDPLFSLQVWPSSNCQANFTINQLGEVYLAGSVLGLGLCRFNLEIRVLDFQNNPQSMSSDIAMAIVTIEDLNDNIPEFRHSNPLFLSITENTPLNEPVLKVDVEDLDVGENALIDLSVMNCTAYKNCLLATYLNGNCISENKECPFKLSSQNHLYVSNQLDFEEASIYDVSILASDNGTPSQSSLLQIIISILDENDSPVMVHPSSIYKELPENALPGTVITVVAVRDDDAFGSLENHTFSIVSSPFLSMDFNISSGELILLESLDYEAVPLVKIALTVSDNLTSADTFIQLTVGNVNDNTPEFSKARYYFNISESAKIGDFVGSVTASDLDSPEFGPLLYSLIGNLLPFEVDQSGILSVSSILDFETDYMYTFSVLVQDSNGEDSALSNLASVVVFVINVNDNPPNLVSPGGNVIVTAPETNNFFNLSALDPDDPANPNPHVEFFIISQQPLNKDNISAQYRIFIRVQDRNDPTSYSVGNHTVVLTFDCNLVAFFVDRYSGELSLSTLCSLEIEAPPSVPVGSSVTLRCLAVGNAVLVYSWYQGAVLVARTGTYSTLALRNVSMSAGGQYSCEAQNAAGLLASSPKSLEVVGPPSIFGLIDKEVLIGTSCTFECIVDSSSNFTLVWVKDGVLIDDSSDNIEIANETLTILNTRKSDEGTFSCIATNLAGSTRSDPGILSVCDCREPYTGNFTFSIPRKTSMIPYFVGSVLSPYHDYFKYNYIIDQGESVFSVDSQNGSLFLTQSIESETELSHVLVIGATDPTGIFSGVTYVTIDVVEVNARAPVFIGVPSQPLSVQELLPINSTILTFYVADNDPGRSGLVEVSIKPMLDHALFGLYETVGERGKWSLFTRQILNASVETEFSIYIVATDLAPSPRSVQIRLVIVVEDVNQPPIFIQSCAKEDRPCDFSFLENSVVGYNIGCINAFDVDKGKNGQLEYSLSNNISFTINSSGCIFLNDNFDFDILTTKVWVLKLIVNDGGNLGIETEVSIRILDVNDISPVFISNSLSFNLRESFSHSVFGTVSAIDGDSGVAGEVVYSLQNTSVFSISPDTGDLTLLDRLDFELQEVYMINVTATDKGIPPLKSDAILTITVVNINDNAPEFIDTPNCTNVAESVEAGDVVAALSAVDRDMLGLTYGLAANVNSDFFVVDESTGYIRLLQEVDAEDHEQFQLSFTVHDTLFSDQTYRCFSIVDVNDNLPLFSESEYYFAVPLSALPGYIVGYVQASDRDRSVQNGLIPLQYSIIGGNDKQLFELNTLSGAVMLATKVNASQQQYLQVSVIDDGSIPDHADVFIEIYDDSINLPFFANNTLHIYVLENNEVGLKLAQLDIDQVLAHFSASDVAVSIMVAEALVDVKYDNTSRILLLQTSVDREILQDPIIVVQVMISSTGSSNSSLSSEIYLQIVDQNDNVPQFISNGPFNILLPEDNPAGLQVLLIEVADMDFGLNSEVMLELHPNRLVCAELLSIDQSGSIKVNNISTVNNIETCHYTIRATDKGSPALANTTRLTVTFEDINNHDPEFQQESYNFTVNENDNSIFYPFGFVAAMDNDRNENALLSYSLVPNTVKAFKSGIELLNSRVLFLVGSTSGGLVTTVSLDFEIEDKYTFQVQAQDSGSPPRSSRINVTVFVMNFNDNPPRFGSHHYLIKVNESLPIDSIIFSPSVEDIDGPANQPFFFWLYIFPSNVPLTVDRRSGIISLSGLLDFEQTSLVSASLTVSDGLFLGRALLSIVIENVNDGTPLFQVDCSGRIPEDYPLSKRIVRCLAIDSDKGSFGELKYSIISGNENDLFAITPFTAEISLNKPLDFETKSFYSLTILVTDGGGINATTVALISVENVDDNSPRLVGDTSFTISEIPLDKAINLLNLTAQDDDTPNVQPVVTFSLASDTKFDLLRQNYFVSVRISESSGRFFSETIISVYFDSQCLLADFKIVSSGLQESLVIHTLCSIELSVFGPLVQYHTAIIEVTAMGILEVEKYCWFRNKESLGCIKSNQLRLSNLTSDDQGTYHAVGYTTLGTIQSETLEIDIQIPPTVQELSDWRTQFNEPVILSCWINNPKYVPVKATWLKEGVVLDSVQTTENLFFITYAINNVQFSDQGTYTCEIRFGDGETRSSSAELFVHYGSSLISLDIQVYNYSYEDRCQEFDIYAFLDDVAEFYEEGATPSIVSFRAENVCQEGPCYPNPCANGGQCQLRGNTSACVCLPGWTGTFCDEIINECSKDVCLLDGTCVSYGLNSASFSCVCHSQRTGQNCELIKYSCNGNPCSGEAGTICLLSEYSPKGYVCNPSELFHLKIVSSTYFNARGHLPFGSVNFVNTLDSLSLEILSIYDAESIIDVFLDTVVTGCNPRIVMADNSTASFAIVCHDQTVISESDQEDICRALVDNNLFSECTTPRGITIAENIANGRITCDFYMYDQSNESIPADIVLQIVTLQSSVIQDTPDFEVLAIQRSNNLTDDQAAPILVSSGSSGFPAYAAGLLAGFLTLACLACCIVTILCAWWNRRKKKIVEKQFIVQRSSGLTNASSFDNDYGISGGYLAYNTRPDNDEYIDDEEFYVNPNESKGSDSIWDDNSDANARSLNSQQSLLSIEDVQNGYVDANDVNNFHHQSNQTVTIKNPLTGNPEDNLKMSSQQSILKGATIEEENPLYSSRQEFVIQHTETTVHEDVTVEMDDNADFDDRYTEMHAYQEIDVQSHESEMYLEVVRKTKESQ